MKDRVSRYPGRVKLTPVVGQENVYDMTLADEPTENGTKLDKNTFLSDETAKFFDLGEDAVPNDVLKYIGGEQGASLVPVGTVIWFSGSTAPAGFLVCDGSHFNTATYPALYSVLKKQYLPNLIGKFVKGSETVGSTFTGSYFMESVYTGSMGTATFAPYLRIANPSRTVTTSDSKYSRADIVGRPGSVTSTNKYLEPPYITLLPCIKY